MGDKIIIISANGEGVKMFLKMWKVEVLKFRECKEIKKMNY